MNEQNNSNSSLSKYYRRPKISVKLPTNGLWYNSDIVELTENATVNILPMTGLDEIKAQTPELITDTNFKFDLIRSCVPAIKQPEKMAAVDINAIMFGIYAASYGKNYRTNLICPHCLEAYNALKTEEEKKSAIDNSEVNINPQKFDLHAESVLALSKYAMNKDIYFDYDNDLRIYLKPVSIDVVDSYNTNNYYQEMLEEKIQKLTDDANNDIIDKKTVIEKIQNEVKKYSDQVYGIVLEMLIKSVSHIVIISTNETITDEKEIADFIKNSPHELIDKIKNLRDKEIDTLGLPDTVKVECNCCHKLFDANPAYFDPTAFFDIAS